MKSISREDYGYYEAPFSDKELEEQEEKKADKEYHDELMMEDKICEKE